MTDLPKYIARDGYRFEVWAKSDGRLYMRQSPTPRWGRNYATPVTREEVLSSETWEAYKARRDAAKKTKAGTCQICGRPILFAQGVIAHHGYERPLTGFQTDSCAGARYVPFEVSRDRLGEYIGILKDLLEKRRARLPELLAPDYSEGLYVRDKREGTRYLNRGDKDFAAALQNLIAQTRAEIAALPDEIERQQGRFDAWKPQI